MDIVRRNTDYALRAMIHLARNFGTTAVSTRSIADSEDISYQLACKLMQRLNSAGLVKSSMGPKGGFALSRNPRKINLLEIIVAVQGPVSVNRCLAEGMGCDRQPDCPISGTLEELQDYIENFLTKTTLDKMCKTVSKAQQK
ncbi:MAG: Rrf2 family transcriptional regulator [Planctomycetes bacterium]|nr:Rrf2 family transcriptional regulator [Planctomycetota bacterium]